jgi:hypothetical protein
MSTITMDKKKPSGWVDKNNKKRTIYLPESLDKTMRIISAERGSSYSEIAIEAFEDFISKTRKK